jgi:hypothetical protein
VHFGVHLKSFFIGFKTKVYIRPMEGCQAAQGPFTLPLSAKSSRTSNPCPAAHWSRLALNWAVKPVSRDSKVMTETWRRRGLTLSPFAHHLLSLEILFIKLYKSFEIQL